MTALPTTTVAFSSAATEAEFKTFLSDLRAFLAGLLGTDGMPATARAALGVPAGSSIVASFNTRTGAVTLTYGDVTGALGFTPAVAGASAPANGGNSDTVDSYHGNQLRISSISAYATAETVYITITRADGTTISTP